ncbi:hypothetical protein JTE90_021629 [Oedothorax gibbosus]|uniref:Uncharacterized protein n=1 Tax=Oedothorax gibbosus TaxID=931172 RepID=A0AAV6VRQ0_9ARAC|nr:hypothetical protein JTE90_021629 [Oedothorax gibbosus]
MDLGLAGLASSVVDLSLRDIPREIVKEHFDARHWSLEWTWWDTTETENEDLTLQSSISISNRICMGSCNSMLYRLRKFK